MIKSDEIMEKISNSVKLLSKMLSQRMNLKKAAIFMAMSITLFSIFPLLIPLFHQFYTWSLSFFNLFFLKFNYSPERNYMFIFCNGILAFVIRNSVLSANTHLGRISSVHHQPITKKRISFDQEYQMTESSHGEEEIIEMENGFLISEEKEEDEEEEDPNLNPMDEEDELNKKCDDFIRRMKQGIRIEANKEMDLDQKRIRRSYDVSLTSLI